MDKDIRNAVLYGLGYMAGKHNLEMSKDDREQIAEKYANQLANSSNDIQNVRCSCPNCKSTNTIQLTKTKDRCLDCIHDYYI